MQNFGKSIFKIDQVLEEKNISKNKLEKEVNFHLKNIEIKKSS